MKLASAVLVVAFTAVVVILLLLLGQRRAVELRNDTVACDAAGDAIDSELCMRARGWHGMPLRMPPGGKR
jgi:hypothetical protein